MSDDAVRLTFGSHNGSRLSFKHDGEATISRDVAGLRTATIVGWTKIAVLFGTRYRVRCIVIRPGPDGSVSGLDPFAVRGFGSVASVESDTRSARALYQSFSLPGNSGN